MDPAADRQVLTTHAEATRRRQGRPRRVRWRPSPTPPLRRSRPVLASRRTIPRPPRLASRTPRASTGRLDGQPAPPQHAAQLRQRLAQALLHRVDADAQFGGDIALRSPRQAVPQHHVAARWCEGGDGVGQQCARGQQSFIDWFPWPVVVQPAPHDAAGVARHAGGWRRRRAPSPTASRRGCRHGARRR